MTTRTEMTLPAGTALVETFDGRWFPAFVPSEENPLRWVHLIDGPLDIPPALDGDPEAGYQMRAEAIAACWAWQEAAVLPFEWEAVARQIEVYPERAAWYIDEIAQLTGNTRQVQRSGPFASVSVAQPSDQETTITAHGANPDEAIENLYQCVYEWACPQQMLPLQRAS
ncbi:MAG TPA: hypothetical protein VGT44_18330 [Ktedonobacteraceae bacterium]|nr:hypothetical protein [Ktedonobacteraceae bacterium]